MVHAAHNIATAITSLCGFMLFTGCVMQSTYDAALKEGQATKLELARELEEQHALTRQLSDLELQKADVMREAEGAVADLQLAKDDAEQEHRQLEQRIATLMQQVAQATKQQRSLRYELTVAKENAAALEEQVEGHQRKIRDGVGTEMPAAGTEPTVHKPFDPSTIPLPQDLPVLPTVTPQQPVPTPAATPPAPVNRAKTAEAAPTEEDWLTGIKNWILSLWRSLFS